MSEKIANRRRVEEIALMDVDALVVNCGGVAPADAAAVANESGIILNNPRGE